MAGKIYKGSQLIKKVYKGGQEVKRIYKGSTLIWMPDPYNPGTVLVNLSAASSAEQSVSLAEGVYKLELVGGGGGGGGYFVDAKGRHIQYASGASGGALVAELKLGAGTYKYRCGAAGNAGAQNVSGTAGTASYFKNADGSAQATAGGGGNGIWNTDFSVIPSGGTVTVSGFNVAATLLSKQGNPGNPRVQYSSDDTAGGASVYEPYGKGGGSKSVGAAGLCRLTYLRAF